MFDHSHYVPVLRWKRGEWSALRDVGEADRHLITPIIELAPKDFLDWQTKGRGPRKPHRPCRRWLPDLSPRTVGP